MGKDSQQKILRVSATPGDIKKSYGILSKFYALLEENFEKGTREKSLELLSVKEGESVLEIGIGTGCSLEEIAGSAGTTGKVYGLDATPEMLRLTEKRLQKANLANRVELLEGDARTMPYQDNLFDAVFMSATLELFDTPDIPKVLGEIKRVLKPGGRLGIASLSKEARENFWFLRLYEWLHQKFPKYASCRPIYVELTINDAGFSVLKSEEFMIMDLVPMKLVVATPGG